MPKRQAAKVQHLNRSALQTAMLKCRVSPGGRWFRPGLLLAARRQAAALEARAILPAAALAAAAVKRLRLAAIRQSHS